MRLQRRTARALRRRASAAKNALRQYLMRSFPIGYEILFTPGNIDEPLGAAIAGHREFVRLMRQPGLRALVTDYPLLVYRHYRRYLANSFTKRTRRAVLKQHYLYLLTRVNATFFSEILRNRPRLWHQTIGRDVFDIRLSFTGDLHHEGDLQLEFRENSIPLYYLSFTISPGYLVGSAAGQVILVARVQGVAGQFNAIRRATKTCLHIAPPYLLMAAVQGISDSLNVAVIAGIRNDEQLTAGSDADRNVYFDYDAFWCAHSGTETEKFYLIPVPIRDKPLELIKTERRRRTRLKREFKSTVAETSKATFCGYRL